MFNFEFSNDLMQLPEGILTEKFEIINNNLNTVWEGVLW